MKNSVSVIIPTLNEAGEIEHLVRYVQEFSGDYLAEIIVVDAQSTDGTAELARQAGAKLLSGSKGRSQQMNAGASVAVGEILYFLHADSRPPKLFTNRIYNSVSAGHVAGCFRMRFDSGHWLLRLSAWFTRFNNRLCRGGDQSMFIRKDIFDSIGGFDENLVIFEDNEILSRIRQQGKFDVIQSDLITSARRFRENGTVRLYLIFIWLHTRYRLGASHDALLHSYRKYVK